MTDAANTLFIQTQSKLVELLSRLRLNANQQPTLAVVGSQSAGKSSLVEAFVGIPLTLTKEGTGTRCPTRFSLIYDQSCEKPTVQINEIPEDLHGIKSLNSYLGKDNEIDYRKLPEYLGKIMEAVGDPKNYKEGFTTDEIQVSIKYKYSKNLVFVDLPGVFVNGRGAAESLNCITQYIKENTKNLKLVVVTKSTDDVQNQQILKVLSDSKRFSNWNTWHKNAIFVSTFFDDKLRTLAERNAKAQEYNDFFKEHCLLVDDEKREINLDKYFVGLLPDPKISKEDMLKKVESLEISTPGFSRLVDVLGKSHSSLSTRVGVRNCREALNRAWYQQYKSNFDEIMVQIDRLISEKEEENVQFQKYKDDDTEFSKFAKQKQIEYFSAIVSSLRKIVEGRYDYLIKDSVRKKALSWEQESTMLATDNVVTWKPWEAQSAKTLMENLNKTSQGGKSLSDHLQTPIIGAAQMKRVFNIIKATTLAQDLDKDEARYFFESAKSYCFGVLNRQEWDKAKSEFVFMLLLKNVKPAIKTLREYVKFCYDYWIELSVELIKEEKKLDSFEEEIVDCCQGEIQELVGKYIRSAEKLCEDLLESHHVILDISLIETQASQAEVIPRRKQCWEKNEGIFEQLYPDKTRAAYKKFAEEEKQHNLVELTQRIFWPYSPSLVGPQTPIVSAADIDVYQREAMSYYCSYALELLWNFETIFMAKVKKAVQEVDMIPILAKSDVEMEDLRNEFEQLMAQKVDISNRLDNLKKAKRELPVIKRTMDRLFGETTKMT